MTPAECRTKAHECDELARTCSYMKDRDRLMKEAAAWLERAYRLEAQADKLAPSPNSPKTPFWRRPG